MLSLRKDYYFATSSTDIQYMYSNTRLRPIYIDIGIVKIDAWTYVTKPRIQKKYFSHLFIKHLYLAYYKSLASDIFNTHRKHSGLVDCVSDYVHIGPSFHFIKFRKII